LAPVWDEPRRRARGRGAAPGRRPRAAGRRARRRASLPSSARPPRRPVSAIVGLLVDESLPGIDAGNAVAGLLQRVSAGSESPPGMGASPDAVAAGRVNGGPLAKPREPPVGSLATTGGGERDEVSPHGRDRRMRKRDRHRRETRPLRQDREGRPGGWRRSRPLPSPSARPGISDSATSRAVGRRRRPPRACRGEECGRVEPTRPAAAPGEVASWLSLPVGVGDRFAHDVPFRSGVPMSTRSHPDRAPHTVGAPLTLGDPGVGERLVLRSLAV
jgi:hypothetical protein